MTKDEAKQQIEAFLAQLGDKEASVFDEKNFAKAQLGDAFMGFVYGDNEKLSCQALIYRFRKPPKEQVMDAIEAESKNAPNGGGEIAFDEDNFTLLLQKDFGEKVSNEEFYKDMQDLAQASLVWSNEVLTRVAERAYP